MPNKKARSKNALCNGGGLSCQLRLKIGKLMVGRVAPRAPFVAYRQHVLPIFTGIWYQKIRLIFP
jgi:hypothetical protein